MFTSKLRIAALLVLTTLLLAAGSAFLPRGAHGDPAPAAPKVPKELLEKRLMEANATWDMMWEMSRMGRAEFSLLFGWSERLLDAEMALADKKEDRAKALQGHLNRTREFEQLAAAKLQAARVSPALTHAASYERYNAEIRYFQETGKVPPPAPEIIIDRARPKGDEELPPPKEKGNRSLLCE